MVDKIVISEVVAREVESVSAMKKRENGIENEVSSRKVVSRMLVLFHHFCLTKRDGVNYNYLSYQCRIYHFFRAISGQMV